MLKRMVMFKFQRNNENNAEFIKHSTEKFSCQVHNLNMNTISDVCCFGCINFTLNQAKHKTNFGLIQMALCKSGFGECLKQLLYMFFAKPGRNFLYACLSCLFYFTPNVLQRRRRYPYSLFVVYKNRNTRDGFVARQSKMFVSL